MAKQPEEPGLLSTLQDILIFQMAVAGVPQSKIRNVMGVDMNRVNRIAKVVKKTRKSEEG